MAAIFTKWFPAGFRLIDGLKLSNWFNNPQTSTEDAITAFATGGQAGAYQLSANTSRISVCVTNGDSVKLPNIKTTGGACVTIINDGAANAQVFAFGSDATLIDGINGSTTGVTITAARRAEFYNVNGAWYSAGAAKTT